VHICVALPMSTGGIGRHVRTLVVELRDRAYEVTVVGPEATNASFGFESAGARFVAAPTGLGSPAAIRRARVALAQQARDVDVVHVHGVRVAASTWRSKLPPVVATWHNAPIGDVVRRAAHSSLELVAARAARVTIGASEDLVTRARRAGARDARFVPVVAPTNRPAPGAEPAPALPPPYLLVVARLAEQKRLDVLIRATAGWRDMPGKPAVLVAGDGPLRSTLQAQAAEARAPLVFLGHRTDVPSLLQNALALVLTSEWEARPLAIQEALQAGTPVVATAVGGIPGLVAEAGLLVPAGDAGALRSVLHRLIDDVGLQAELATACLARATLLPSTADMIEQLLAIYSAVAR
jgi:glycosyltransferase involved in cell wall biosynthesis